MASSRTLAAEWSHAEWEAVWTAMSDNDADLARSPRPSVITWLHVCDVCEKAPNKRKALHRGLFHLLADEYSRRPEAEPGGFDQALTTRVRRKCSDFHAAIKKCDDTFRAAKSRGDAAAQELAQRRKACVRTSPLWSVVATAAVLGSIEELNAAYGAAKTAGWWLCMCIMRACTRACE